jgi:putative nucleotidyltransferase with HDIG domain
MRISIHYLKNGDQLIEDVYSASGLHLLSAHTILVSQDIQYLKKHNVDFVSIKVRDIHHTAPEQTQELADLPNQISPFTVVAFHDAIVGVKDIFDRAALNDQIEDSSVNASFQPLMHNIKQEKDVVGLLLSLGSDDDYTFQHCVQVGLISYFLAGWLNKSEEEAKFIGKAGFLHDIGKSKVDIAILNKPGKLTPEEFNKAKMHTTYGYEIIMNSLQDEDLAAAALQHHERSDGSGYPEGRTADSIHPFAKIIAVADIYSAMISKRVYSDERDLLYVLKELNQMSFGKLDPTIVQTFITNMLPNFIGKKVLLTNGHKGTIIMTNPTDYFRPLIQIDEQFIDMNKNRDLEIQTIVV